MKFYLLLKKTLCYQAWDAVQVIKGQAYHLPCDLVQWYLPVPRLGTGWCTRPSLWAPGLGPFQPGWWGGERGPPTGEIQKLLVFLLFFFFNLQLIDLSRVRFQKYAELVPRPSRTNVEVQTGGASASPWEFWRFRQQPSGSCGRPWLRAPLCFQRGKHGRQYATRISS